jgi:hypothetical protein
MGHHPSLGHFHRGAAAADAEVSFRWVAVWVLLGALLVGQWGRFAAPRFAEIACFAPYGSRLPAGIGAGG